jgi:hypothetical protein
MTLEKQVCSLELAKRLKELGVKQESYFDNADGRTEPWHIFSEEYRQVEKQNSSISVFTVAELGELLPVGFRSFSRWGKKDDKDVLVWRCESPTEHAIDQWPIEADTEANVRAKYLAKLIESGAYMRKD